MVRVNPPQHRSSTDLLVGAVGNSCKQKFSRGPLHCWVPTPWSHFVGSCTSVPSPITPPAARKPQSPQMAEEEENHQALSLLQTWENLALDHGLLRTPVLGQDPPEANPEIWGQARTRQVGWWFPHRYALAKSLVLQPEALFPLSSLGSFFVKFRYQPTSHLLAETFLDSMGSHAASPLTASYPASLSS